jgi:RHS repeat-associated protein
MAFNQPSDLIYDASKNALYMSDTGSNRVVRIDLNSEIATTIAGNGTCDPNNPGDNGSGQLASLCEPTSLGLDSSQNLLILDTGHKRIRRLIFSPVQGGALAFSPSAKDLSNLVKNADGTWTRTYRNGDVAKFDASGAQTQSMDRVGRVTQFSYDDDHNLTQMTDPAGLVTTYSYSGGKLTTISDPAGRNTTFTYSGTQLIAVGFPDGTSKAYDYNALGFLTKERDQRGYETSYAYNNWGRITQVTYPDNTTTQVGDSYSSVANQAATGTASLGQLGLGDNQLADSVIDAKSSETRFSKGLNGYVTRIKNALNQETTIERDIDGYPTKVTRADGTAVVMNYDPTTKDALSSLDEATGVTESKTYNQYGQVATMTDGRGLISSNQFDATKGLLLSATAPNGTSVNYTYNQQGLPLMITRYLDQNTAITTVNEYDSVGNLTRQVYPDGKETQFQYDLAGNQIKAITIQSLGVIKSTLYTYDPMNRLTQVTEPNGESTVYQYYPSGELKQITDPKNNVTTFNYNSRGKLISKTDPSGKTTTMAYDANLNLQTLVDPNGNQKTYDYDPLNRLSVAALPDDVFRFYYSQRGDLVRTTNKNSDITTIYDTKHNLIYTNSLGTLALADYPFVEISNTFDGDRNRVSTELPQGIINYSYDNMNRPTGLSDLSGANFNFYYDNLNRLTQIQRPGSVTNFSYSPASMLTQIAHANGQGNIDYFNYAYNLRNEIISRQSQVTNQGFTYDGNGQLTAVTGTNPETFIYDSLGNQTQNNLGTFTYDTPSQRLTEDWQYVYSYDNNGNLITKVNKDQNKSAYTYSYNSLNQLTRIQITSSALGPVIKDIYYNYDALGRRMEKRVNDLLDSNNTFQRRYVYDGSNIISEFDGDNQLLANFTHSPLSEDDVLAESVTSSGVSQGLAASSGSFYFMKDSLGSVTHVTNASGTLLQKYEYSAFGKITAVKDAAGADISSSPSLRSQFTFTGREFDDESGLYFYRARSYDPGLGRFLQVDPDAGKMRMPITKYNSYIYVANNPLRFTDPKGQFFELPVLGAIIGGIIGGVAKGIETNWRLPDVIGGILAGAILGFVYGTVSESMPILAGTLVGSNILKSMGRGGNSIVNFWHYSSETPTDILKATIGLGLKGSAIDYLGESLVTIAPIAISIIDVSENNCDEKEGTWNGSDYCRAYQTPFR